MDTSNAEDLDQAAEVAHACLEHVRDGLQAELPTWQ